MVLQASCPILACGKIGQALPLQPREIGLALAQQVLEQQEALLGLPDLPAGGAPIMEHDALSRDFHFRLADELLGEAERNRPEVLERPAAARGAKTGAEVEYDCHARLNFAPAK